MQPNMLSDGPQKQGIKNDKPGSSRYKEKQPKLDAHILAASTPNKFELTKKFAATGMIDLGQPG